ncbi:type II toxin-antitoxin system VapC family toxin [Granulicella arctica]|uniref:type II toxin-antitoxin system VapC family toxin n=1 Tax=Granulicella arctica TaxID=940613 RepID=UPI0021E0ECA2|nr:type II toxin-antitoxin system VapC family toxin [Granulicella arctica]
MFLLDTNVVSEMRKTRPHGGVLAWYGSHTPQSFYLPAVAFYELQAGVERTRTQDQAKADQIEAWIDRIVTTASIVSLDAVSARMTAKLMHGQSPDLFEDAMIAAIAKVNGLTVATRNVRHFKVFNVAIVDPFSFPM